MGVRVGHAVAARGGGGQEEVGSADEKPRQLRTEYLCEHGSLCTNRTWKGSSATPPTAETAPDPPQALHRAPSCFQGIPHGLRRSLTFELESCAEGTVVEGRVVTDERRRRVLAVGLRRFLLLRLNV